MSVPALNLALMAVVVMSILGIVTVGSILDQPRGEQGGRSRLGREANPGDERDDFFPGGSSS